MRFLRPLSSDRRTGAARSARVAARWAVVGLCLLGLVASPAAAQPRGPQVDRYSAIVIEAESGRVLSSLAADEPRYPASLTKMMTLFMLFEALRDHRVGLDQLVPVSGHAASMEPSKLGLLPSTRITVEQAILGLVTKSANDAAAALGEMMGGDEASFARMMTARAHAIGMAHTTFRNASGLPDPDQVTTARDLAILARHIIRDFPAQYAYFSVPSFQFRGRTIYNHDRMLQSYPGADGLKTGFITASGHNLATSAVHGGVRLIGIVMGARTNGERDVDMKLQLDDGFTQMGVAPVMMVAAEPPRSTMQRAANVAIPRAEAGTLPGHVGILPAPPRPLPPAPPAGPSSASWAVQAGAWPTEAAARRAASAAHREGGEIRIETTQVKGHVMWRAMVVGLHHGEASSVCAALAGRHEPCMVLPPAQLAAR